MAHKILIADDEPNILISLEYLMKREGFDVSVAKPAYATSHPKVLFDEAHFNVHSMKEGYKPFAGLVANDGYAVVANGTREQAEMHVFRLHEHGLWATMEKDGPSTLITPT